MADYSADPLWYRTPEGKGSPMISLDALPLSAELKSQLRAWVRHYEEIAATGGSEPSPAAKTEWIAEGRALLVPLRQELGPGYDVEYFEDQG